MLRPDMKAVAAVLFVLLIMVCGRDARADQFLPEFRPFGDVLRFALHGDYQIFAVHRIPDDDGTGRLRAAHTLTLEPDVQITDTFRLHARWRPLKNEFFSVSEGEADNFGSDVFKDESLERAFFEAQVAGFDAAGGRVPLLFHNLYMAQDDVLGFLIARNTFSILSVPNIRFLAFGTAAGKLSELDGRGDRQVGLYGVDAVIDTNLYIVEGTVGYLHDEHDSDLKEQHAGLSVIRIQQRRSTSLRAFGSFDGGRQHTGWLFIMEHSYVFPTYVLDRPTWYLDAFRGTKDYQSMASGSLKNLGFLFDQLDGAPQLANSGVDASGFATGVLLGRSRDFTVTPEFAAVFDEGPLNNDQLAGGIRTQARLLDTSFLRVDLVFLHQDVDVNEDQYGATAQVVYKF